MISFPGRQMNLGLNILRKRPDGYHDLQSVFLPCDAFHDRLEIEPAESFSIEIRMALGPCPWNPESDLTAKAWRLMHEKFGIGPVAIRMVKGIPVGAGLGGGSADAAFALRMLSEMFSLGLSSEELAELAAMLGSDCPFFIYNRPMMSRGRGEILSPVEVDLSGYEIRVIKPEGISVSTKEAYSGVVPCEDAPDLEQALLQPVGKWKELFTNDFEKSVFALHPELAAIKDKLYADGAIYACMSGSGSALFGIFSK